MCGFIMIEFIIPYECSTGLVAVALVDVHEDAIHNPLEQLD